MKIYFFFILFLITSLSFGQQDFTEKDAIQLIDTFFEGFHKGDTLLIKTTMTENMPMQTAFVDASGVAKVSDGDVTNFLKAIAARPAEQVWEEKLLDYNVSIDGTLAHVWTPYSFYINGKFSHCGSNAFTLAKIGDNWKIIHIIDSRRREDCK